MNNSKNEIVILKILLYSVRLPGLMLCLLLLSCHQAGNSQKVGDDLRGLTVSNSDIVLLPFQTDFDRYGYLAGQKAFAIAVDGGPTPKYSWSWSVGHHDLQTAELSALSSCRATVRNLGRYGACQLYAINDKVVFRQ